MKDFGKKRSHVGLISMFGRFSCRRYCTLGTWIF